MSDYTNTYGGAAKDAAEDIILGADVDTQLDSLATMSATKANKLAGATVDNLVTMDANGDMKDGGVQIADKANLAAPALTGAATLDGAAILSTDDEGSGNGLDADTVDGQHAAALLALANATGTLATSQIAALAVTEAKIAAGAVTNGKIGALAVDTAEIAALAITTAKIAASAVGRSQIANSTTTSAGSLNSTQTVGFTLNDWALFPMIHGAAGNMNVDGHSVDGGSASAPRFSLRNNDGGTQTYDVDHRWIIAA